MRLWFALSLGTFLPPNLGPAEARSKAGPAFWERGPGHVSHREGRNGIFPWRGWARQGAAWPGMARQGANGYD